MMETGGKLSPRSAAVALPTFTFSDELTLHTSAGDIHAIHFPHGHTNTNSVIFPPKSKVLQTGDNFVNSEVPGFPVIDQDTDGSRGVEGEIAIAEYILARAPDDVKIIPGHGIWASKADLRKELAVLKQAPAAVQLGISQGKNLDQLKPEKAFAKWDYLNESHHIQSDLYLERPYKDLSRPKSN